MTQHILAADIGGTYARFALVRFPDDEVPSTAARTTYANAELEGWRDGMERFLRSFTPSPIDRVAVAVAGPVEHGEGRLTNRDWHLRADDIARMLDGVDVRLFNGFEALGFAVPFLTNDDLVSFQEGAPDGHGVRVLLGAGTGLGQAVVVPRSGSRTVDVYATEGGHATFAARTDAEWNLRAYLAARYGTVSSERVLSGQGIHDIYDFLVHSGRFTATPATRAAMRDGDPGVVITRQAVQERDPACVRTLDLFTAAYGARAGDMALTTGARGGVYIAGGIAMELHAELRKRGFLEAFLDKGRMRPWLENVPVHVIVRPDAGLMGAALAALPADALERVPRLPAAAG